MGQRIAEELNAGHDADSIHTCSSGGTVGGRRATTPRDGIWDGTRRLRP